MNWQEFVSSYQQEVGVTNLEPSRGAIPIFFEKTSKTRELAEFFSSYWQEIGVTKLEPPHSAIPVLFGKTKNLEKNIKNCQKSQG